MDLLRSVPTFEQVQNWGDLCQVSGSRGGIGYGGRIYHCLHPRPCQPCPPSALVLCHKLLATSWYKCQWYAGTTGSKITYGTFTIATAGSTLVLLALEPLGSGIMAVSPLHSLSTHGFSLPLQWYTSRPPPAHSWCSAPALWCVSEMQRRHSGANQCSHVDTTGGASVLRTGRIVPLVS